MTMSGKYATISTALVGILCNDDMNKKKIIESILNKSLDIKRCESSKYFYAVLPVRIQREYGLPKKLTAPSEEMLINRLFDNLTQGSVRKDTLADVYEHWYAERQADLDIARHTLRKHECDWNTHLRDYLLQKLV